MRKNAEQLRTIMIGQITRPRIKLSERKKVIREHADRIAAERDSWIRKNAAYYGEDWRYMRFLIPAGARVLDLGCGTGDLLATLEPSLGVGVDLSPAMIERAESKYPDLTFLVGDAEGRKEVDDHAGLYFQLTCQLIDANFAHTLRL